jgi:hypothetical protein
MEKNNKAEQKKKKGEEWGLLCPIRVPLAVHSLNAVVKNSGRRHTTIGGGLATFFYFFLNEKNFN